MFGVETIERFLHSSYDQFATRASIPNFLPLLAERFARQRLRAWPKSKANPATAGPWCCFCAPITPDARRSRWDSSPTWPQMARSHGPAAPNPATRSTPPRRRDAERGIDIAGEYPKPWTDEIVQATDVVITMGCGDACPVFPGRRYEEWVLDDPAGLDLDGVRPIRDDIEERVRRLLTDLRCAQSMRNHTRTPPPAVAADPTPSGHTGPPGYVSATRSDPSSTGCGPAIPTRRPARIRRCWP